MPEDIQPIGDAPSRVKLRHAEGGAMEITVNEWVYVRVNYDYRYTDNAHRMTLARQIFDLLTKGAQ